MNAETYLDRIKKIDAMIKNKLRDYQRWVEQADGLGGAALGERVQSSRNLHRGSDAIDTYIDLEREINALKKERQSIIATIEQLPSTEYGVLYKYYVENYTLKEIAHHFRKCYDWARYKKQDAIDLVQGLLDAQAERGNG